MPITQVISLLPEPPNLATDTPDVFSRKAVAVVQAQVDVVPQMNIWAQQANSTAAALMATVGADAVAASISAGNASQGASQAAESAATAQALAETAAQAAAASKWVPGTTYSQGSAVWSPADFRTYRRRTNGAGTTDPAIDPTNWAPMAADASVIRKARSSNTILTVADNRALIDITSGTFTQTFAACSALGNGWTAVITNNGTGRVTLDPNASETIDGLSSFAMLPNESRQIFCDGATLRTLVLRPFYIAESVSGSMPRPPGYKLIAGRMWAGGSSGQASGQNISGGAGGACVDFVFPAESLGANEAYLIGSGGVASSTATKNTGGDTSFAGLVAQGRIGLQPDYNGGVPNNGPTHDPVVFGGGAGGGISNSAMAFGGGISRFGGNGGAASTTGNGGAGIVPGGGGGNTSFAGASGGAGARGEFRAWGIV